MNWQSIIAIQGRVISVADIPILVHGRRPHWVPEPRPGQSDVQHLVRFIRRKGNEYRSAKPNAQSFGFKTHPFSCFLRAGHALRSVPHVLH